MQPAAAYLDSLNPEQRRAVEHGAVGQGPFAPLLVIAGAGSGKTNTLAHRVAHLIVNGADPRRILLMTFSRRAASEMTKRVERIARKVMGDNAGVMTDALAWSGTFHGIGARLLRDYSDQIGLDPAVHDPRPRGFRRPDEPDPARKGILEDRKPVSDQGHVPFDLFALRQRRDRDRAGARCVVSVVLRLGGRAEGTVRGLCRGQAEAERARLRRPAAVLGADHERPGAGRRHRRPVRSRAGRRISGHQPAAVVDPAGAEARRPWPHRGRRRCPIDLLVPGSDGAQHPRLPDAVLAAGQHHHARPQLPLDADHPGRRQRRHRSGQGALHQEPLDRTDFRRQAAACHRARRGRPGPLHRRAHPREP